MQVPFQTMRVSVQTEPVDVTRETFGLSAGRPSIGAIASFIGLVRGCQEGEGIQSLFLEHYPGMAEREIERILEEAEKRWSLEAVRVVHRVGELKVGEPIVLVLVASQHRGDAFSACEFIMDFLKTRAPFWKKEQSNSGEAAWVESRTSDQERLVKWQGASQK